MLTDDQAQKVRMMLSTAGWNEVVKPWLAQRGKNVIQAVVTPKENRPGSMKGIPTNVLRGRLEEIEAMLSVWSNELQVYDENRRRDELDRQGADGAPISPANP